jgi:hypothetical protein
VEQGTTSMQVIALAKVLGLFMVIIIIIIIVVVVETCKVCDREQ